MADLNGTFDVAVIDEIQLIEEPERGYAWTNALLGLQAKEIHLCGDERAFKLISKLLETTQDKVRKMLLTMN
jgi:ATP-dependent RNA helicase SUPV3L1/SUV3